jgi:hypothetical protein
MSDQKGVINNLTQDTNIAITIGFPLNILAEYARKVKAGVPAYVHDYSVPQKWQSIYTSKAGIEMPAFAMIIMPEQVAGDPNARDLDGEIKLENGFFIPRAVPDVKHTFEFKKGGQQKIDIEYTATYDPVFNFQMAQASVLWRGDHYPTENP